MDERGIYAGPFIHSRIMEEDCLRRKISRLQYENDILRAELSVNPEKVDMPEKYIINENATILFWKDGEKTIVKKCEEDDFNHRLAFLTAFFQHYCGMSKNKANKYLASLEVEKSKENLKDKFVKVINCDETYSRYRDLIMKVFPKYKDNFKFDDIPENGKKYKLLGETCHEDWKHIELCLIQDLETNQVYLISKKAIKEV